MPAVVDACRGIRERRALETAVRHAKDFIGAAIASADCFSVGHGHGQYVIFNGFTVGPSS